jgi:hypothetical protein
VRRDRHDPGGDLSTARTTPSFKDTARSRNIIAAKRYLALVVPLVVSGVLQFLDKINDTVTRRA